jgi:predicted nuclease of predicted toxin-antitoxin system
MKFVVDAQLPRRLARQLTVAGHDALHCSDFPLENRTPDNEITFLAATDHRVVVTKDNDFVTSFWLRGTPPKLLLISTGNISNDSLCRLMATNLPALAAALTNHSFVELSLSAIIIHA